MNIKDRLDQIRPQQSTNFSINKKIIHAILPFVLGVIMGFLAKYIETIPHFGQVGDFLNILGQILSRIGMWVLFATVISAWSRTSKIGALHVFVFFMGLLITYYIYSMMIFHIFPTYYFARWGFIAVISPILAIVAWYGRGDGWIASFCASLPISLILATEYGFYGTFSGLQIFDLFTAILLYVILPTQKIQRLRLIPLVIIVFLIITKLGVLSVLFSGL